MKKSLILIIIGLISTTTFAQVPVNVIPADQQAAWLITGTAEDQADKKLVYDFWRKVLVARDMEAAMEYMDENYIQHNPTIPTGRVPFVQVFGRMGSIPELDHIEDLVAITADGGYVTMAFQRVLENPNIEGQTYTTTWFDMFRVAGDKIVEHWDYGTIGPR